MLSITDRDAVTAALADPTLDPALRALIGLRVWKVDTDRPDRRPGGHRRGGGSGSREARALHGQVRRT